jgi:hypothetical protein
MFLNPPFFVSMATAAKFVQPIPIYMALIVLSSFHGIDDGLHELSFSPGFNIHKLYLK